MKFLFHLIARLRRLKWQDIFELGLVCLTALMVSSAVVTLDAFSISELLATEGILTIGFDYLLVGLVWIPFAYYGIIVERRKGYGTSAYMGLLTLLLVVIIEFGFNPYPLISRHALFVLKYGFIFFIHTCFWAMAGRFISLSMTSLKFWGVSFFELLGFGCGGLFGMFFPYSYLPYCILATFVLTTLLFHILGRFSPVPRETFVKKNGGVQDHAERIMLDMILMINFVIVVAKSLLDFGVLQMIIEGGDNPVYIISMLWALFALVGIGIILLLSQTRFLSTTLWALFSSVGALICSAIGLISGTASLVYIGAIAFMLCVHFYMHRYMSLLARPLALGHGIRLKNIRWCLIIPVGFVTAGVLILMLPILMIPYVLFIIAVCLLFLFVVSAHLYGRQLVKICSLRLWRGGPFMLIYPPLKQMVYQGLSKTNAAEVMYFLSILAEGHPHQYRQCLLEVLTHRAVSVRLFALKKLNQYVLAKTERREVTKLFQGDPCSEVRNMALAVLIEDELERHGTRTWHKYKNYLDDRNYVVGACAGFLSGRGAWLEQVIVKVLMYANSKRESDNLIALTIMGCRPRADWIAVVEKLLNKDNGTITKAALKVVGKLASPILLNRVLSLLDEVRWRDLVWETLDQYGKVAFPTIEKMIVNEDVPLDRRRELILFLGRMTMGEGKQILLRTLFSANRVLRPYIIEALTDSGIVWIHQDRKKLLLKGILLDALEWDEMREFLCHVEELKHGKLAHIKSLLMASLEEEMNRARQMILAQLDLYSIQPLSKHAIKTLREDCLDLYPAAVGDLQDILPKKLYHSVREILLFPLCRQMPDHVEPVETNVLLNQFLLNPPAWVNPWMKSLALFGWYVLNDVAGLTAVKQALKSHDWVVLETALYAFGRLEKNHKVIEDAVLSIPTRYLIHQNFQELLEVNYARHN